MPIDTIIKDISSGNRAGVGADGRVFVGPSYPSEPFNATLGTDDTPVNVVVAKADKKFVITDVFMKANKNVSATVDATVTLYEASSATSATQDKVVLSVPLARSESITLNGLFLNSSPTVYLNAVTDDDDVFVTVLGYYIDG